MLINYKRTHFNHLIWVNAVLYVVKVQSFKSIKYKSGKINKNSTVKWLWDQMKSRKLNKTEPQ